MRKQVKELIQKQDASTLWSKYRVPAASVEDFLARYYKPDRYHGRGEEYAVILLASHQHDFEQDGYDVISNFDSVTGQFVAFMGPE